MPPRAAFTELRARMGRAIIGQERVIERLLVALLANGNVLLEGLPGVAKTRAAKSLAQSLDAEFRRIQFTPDLLPTDVVGSEVYHQEGGGSFRFDPGPIFGNLILVDEINRAPAKVQSALLEAMEERQVTVAGTTHKLPPLFMVMATQNPIEQEGTYPLPEAQLDRFLMHVKVDYPPDADERAVLRLVREEERTAQSGAPPPRPPRSRRIPFSPRAPRWPRCMWRTRSMTMRSRWSPRRAMRLRWTRISAAGSRWAAARAAPSASTARRARMPGSPGRIM